MGGLGSGGWNLKHAGTVEIHRRIDAGSLCKKGMLANGTAGSVTWTRSDGNHNSIKLRFEHGHLFLGYRWKYASETEWKDVVQEIQIHWRDNHFGGQTAYFICPGCGANRRYLYGAGELFKCRTCHDLTYATQRERVHDRATRKNQKLRRRLQSDISFEGLISRPKGMHQKTFERLRDEIFEQEDIISQRMVELVQRFTVPSRAASIRTEHFWT